MIEKLKFLFNTLEVSPSFDNSVIIFAISPILHLNLSVKSLQLYLLATYPFFLDCSSAFEIALTINSLTLSFVGIGCFFKPLENFFFFIEGAPR
ncbi:hypothetical protein D3C81_703760 [compost metagenome]